MMKMISQKHTSKFVAGFLQGLGLVACVSFTSCGDKDSADEQKKKNETDKQSKEEKEKESLKNEIKNCNSQLKEGQIDKIANYCVEHKKKFEDLDEEKLKGLKESSNLSNEIIEGILSSQSKIKEISGSINNGVVTVGNENFDFKTLKGLNEFVSKFNGKKVKIGGSFGFELKDDNIKVCGGTEIAFDENLVKVFDSLISCGDFFKGFCLNINSNKEVCFGQNKVVDDFVKEKKFWNLVKGYSAVFNVPNPNKFGVDKGSNGNVKIENFESNLEYNDVFDQSGKVKDEWSKIFELKTKK